MTTVRSALGALLGLLLIAGCTPAAPGAADVGSPEDCPTRNAYCPASGPGVAWPGRPAVSPSGRFRLEVLAAEPVTAGEDWRFRVVDTQTDSVVLAPPPPAFDGGLGLVFTWDPDAPETVWAGRRSNLTRWSPDDKGQWHGERPGPAETLPAAVDATFDSAAND